MKHLPQISINVITHKDQAYDTCGDYELVDDDCLDVTISKSKADYEFLVMIHELCEWYLTQKRGISIKKITAFDKSFEKKRKKGNTEEPGDSKAAPYHKEHVFATVIEKLVARELKIDWQAYSKVINSL